MVRLFAKRKSSSTKGEPPRALYESHESHRVAAKLSVTFLKRIRANSLFLGELDSITRVVLLKVPDTLGRPWVRKGQREIRLQVEGIIRGPLGKG